MVGSYAMSLRLSNILRHNIAEQQTRDDEEDRPLPIGTVPLTTTSSPVDTIPPTFSILLSPARI